MTTNVLTGRLEMSASILRLAATEAKNRMLPDLARKITDLRVEVKTLIELTNPTLRCECDPATCDKCTDGSCFN